MNCATPESVEPIFSNAVKDAERSYIKLGWVNAFPRLRQCERSAAR